MRTCSLWHKSGYVAPGLTLTDATALHPEDRKKMIAGAQIR